jgi:hypothetical protein
LVREAPWIAQAAHFGEQDRAHFHELGGVPRVGGEVAEGVPSRFVWSWTTLNCRFAAA